MSPIHPNGKGPALKSALRNVNSNIHKAKNRHDGYPKWREEGMRRRRELLQQDEETGGSIFTINSQAKLIDYYQIAERVLGQFHDAIESDQNLQDTYLMGNRLIKFLDEVLPTHDSYDDTDPELMRLRIKSRNNLQLTKLELEKIELEFDKECYTDLESSDTFDECHPSDPSLDQHIQKQVTFAPQESFMTHIVDSASSNENDMLSFENNKIMSQSNEMFSSSNSSNFLHDFSDNEYIFNSGECHDWSTNPPESPHDIFEGELDLFGSSYANPYKDDTYHESQPFDESVQISDEESSGSEEGDFYYTRHVDDSDEESYEEELTFVEQIARENHSQDINNLVEDECDSDAVDSWEQSEDESDDDDHDDDDENSCNQEDAISDESNSTLGISRRDIDIDDLDMSASHVLGESGYMAQDERRSSMASSSTNAAPRLDAVSSSHVVNEDGYYVEEENYSHQVSSEVRSNGHVAEDESAEPVSPSRIFNEDGYYLNNFALHTMRNDYYSNQNTLCSHLSSQRQDKAAEFNNRSLNKSSSYDDSDDDDEHEEFVKRMTELEFASDLESSGEKTIGTSETEAMTADSTSDYGSHSFEDDFVSRAQDEGTETLQSDPDKIDHLEMKVKKLMMRRKSQVQCEPSRADVNDDSKSSSKCVPDDALKPIQNKRYLYPPTLSPPPATESSTVEVKPKTDSNQEGTSSEQKSTSGEQKQRYSKVDRLRRLKQSAHWQRRYGNRSRPEINQQ